LLAEQHDAEETGFKKKCGQHFVTQQRLGDVAHGQHEARPVGTELKTHGDARHHAERKRQREHLDPGAIGGSPGRVAAAAMAQFEEQQQPGQGQGDAGKQDVETHVGGELQTREHDRVHQCGSGGRGCSRSRGPPHDLAIRRAVTRSL
jgi:hypothetical protein